MPKFGKILREFREEKQLSRAELAEGICTEKYLYLIEKGQRTPSATILRLLSQALNIDLFRFYRFTDCKDPIAVEKISDAFAKSIRLGDYDLRGRTVREAEKLADFQKPPWSYVLIGNRGMYDVVVKKESQRVYTQLNEALEQIDPKYEDTPYVSSIYLAFSYTLQFLSRYKEAYEYALRAEKIHKESIDFYYGDGLYFLAECRASILSNLYRVKEYQKAADYGEGLINNLANVGTYARLEVSLGYLAFSLYRLNRIEEAVEALRQSMQILMLTYNQFFLHYLLAEEEFELIIKEIPTNDYVLKEFQLYAQTFQSLN